MALKCVPLNAQWCGSTKLDLRAIYRRRNGDLTSGLPLRGHQTWVAKGLEYVTLADAESLSSAASSLRAEGKNPQDYVAGIDGDGRPTPWNVALYLEDAQVVQAKADADLKTMIEQFGVETVERIKGITVPAHLRPEAEPVKVGKRA